MNNRAWFFAVCRASTHPDLTQALADATESVRLKRNANSLDTLATVRARQGDYPQAIEIEKKALAMVWHDRDSKGHYRRHLAAFQSQRPYFPTVEDRG